MEAFRRFHGLEFIGSIKLNPLYILLLAVIPSIALVYRYKALRHVPGPFLAAFTNIPRFSWVWSRRAHEIHIELHRKYGNLVRFGPNMVSIGDPAEIPKIYGFSAKYNKSDFYHVILPMSKGRILPGLFATQDENIHRMLKKPIASIYSMTNLVSFEPYVDSTIGFFFKQLNRRFAETRTPFDFGVWLQMFAFDVVGEITFSRRLGFLETGTDRDGIMGDIWKYFQYVAPVGQMPWIDSLWVKNPLISLLRSPSWSAMGDFAVARQKERLALGEKDDVEVNSRDFLSRFIQAREKDPSVPEWALLAWTQSNITAGSDTTAIVLRTVFYNLLRHPESLDRILAELREAAKNGELSRIVTWKQSQKLPYLNAVIREAGRLHPPFGLPLERIVPQGGAEICGKFFKQGTIVGMNAWVVHRDKATFGEDADVWRPERWLSDDVAGVKKMESSLLTFGHGHRSCIGKNISYLNIYKLVPSILQAYKIELEQPDRQWRIENRWFVPQFDFSVRLEKRTTL